MTRELADRHYNRQKPGSKQFAPPGKCLVFVIGNPAKAFWISSSPIAKYVQHDWAGAWMCTAFRNEGAGLSSELIEEAVQATIAIWGPPPPLGFVSFVDASKVRSSNPSYCYQMAGWEKVGQTQGGLLAYQLLPEDMPEPKYPLKPREDINTKYAKVLPN